MVFTAFTFILGGSLRGRPTASGSQERMSCQSDTETGAPALWRPPAARTGDQSPPAGGFGRRSGFSKREAVRMVIPFETRNKSPKPPPTRNLL